MNLNLSKKFTAAFLTLCLLISSVPSVLAVGDEPEALNEAPTSGAESNETAEETATVPNQDLVEYANSLANGTHALHKDLSKTAVTVKNKTMSLDYGIIGSSDKMYVQHLSNTQGNAYVENTMDVFVEMADGVKYYASNSLDNAKLNIYRYGYYYYENRLEGQIFINDLEVNDPYDITLVKPDVHNDMTTPNCGTTLSYTSTGSDPYFGYNITDTSVTADNYDFVEITVKIQGNAGSTVGGQLFLVAGDNYTTYTADQSYSLSFHSDSEYHTYQIPLSKIKDFGGQIKKVRFDIAGTVEVSSIRFFKASYTGLDASLSIQRSFLSYSDKLHHLTQFSTLKTIEGIKQVGMETTIDANTVSKLVVKDANGLKYTLDGVDWASAEYVGFDIADAGIFGYILPCDDKSGTMTVTLADGYYVITQTLPVSSFIPSEEGTLNGNDVFFGQRIYNDETHDFATFLNEAEAERNPLTEENFLVDVNDSYGSFVGYDALYGFYRFNINGLGFGGTYYNYQNKQPNVRFTVTGDKYNRTPYILTRGTNSGCIECAVLLDENNMLIPIPMEVAKNFGGDGENTLYNIDDAAYAEAIFPLIVNANESRTYNVINLYQNWGRFPLSQISSIQFHTPYYHLSTGVTETNCIVLLATNGPGLPDHRAMSAPFWRTQPQHNSGGGHSFLRYTDANGVHSQSQNTTAVIDSYGPTYCDITLGYQCTDGSISATYTHTEFPQTDENRAFYELKYTFNKDISFDNFKEDFIFYSVTDNNASGVYEKVGYLNANNESVVVDANHTSTNTFYTLGTESPYFSFFMMPNWSRASKSSEGYTNLSMLFKDWKIESSNASIATTPNLCINNKNEFVYLSMDLGAVDFKAGDTITINAILMPWGSQEMEDDPANRLAANTQASNPGEEDKFYVESADHVADYTSTCPHYSDVLEDGTLYMDKNVRDVRINTLLNPLYATAIDNSCTVLDSPFVPKLKSNDGQTATFTLKGGQNNVATRIYGFDKLTVPYIEEYVNGEWVEYEVSSLNTPDSYGYAHEYDGYMVHYDADGTYSYSFVAAMDYTDTDGRTFRITASEDFDGWEFNHAEEYAPMNRYFDADSIYSKTYKSNHFSQAVLNEEDGMKYVSLYGNGTSGEAYTGFFANENLVHSGKYIVYKYRIPEGTNIGYVQFWTGTSNGSAAGNDHISVEGNAIQADGEWHVMVIDVTKLKDTNSVFSPDEKGMYNARYLRVDFWNKVFSDASHIDVAYIGMSDSLNEILAANSDMDTVSLLTSGTECESVSTTAAIPETAPTIAVESIGVKSSDEFTLSVDLTNNVGISFLRLIPVYNTEVFTLTKVTNGELFSSALNSNGYVDFNNKEEVTANGHLAEFTFKINENAPDGAYSIGLTVADIGSASAGELSIKINEGTVRVITGSYGDCNGDTEINLYDVVLLRKYIADYNYETNTSTVEISNGADANGDGVITANDLTLIRQYLANYDYKEQTSSIVLGPQK